MMKSILSMFSTINQLIMLNLGSSEQNKKINIIFCQLFSLMEIKLNLLKQ